MSEVLGACFSDPQTPTYVYATSPTGEYGVSIEFKNFAPGPQNPSLFNIPSECPTVGTGFVADTAIDKHLKPLEIVQKLLVGDFSFLEKKRKIQK